MLQKILTLNQSHFVKGYSPSEYYDGGAVLWQGKGINPFKYPYGGRLTAGYAPVQISSTDTVKDNIRWMLPDTYSNIANTSAKFPTAEATPPAPLDTPWTNPTNAYTENSSYATFYYEPGSDRPHHMWYNFGLNNDIPEGSTITGVEVQVKAKANGEISLWAYIGKNVLSSSIVSDVKCTDWVASSDTWYSLGGKNDLWNIEDGLTRDDFENDTENGQTFYVMLTGNRENVTLSVDCIRVIVYYAIADADPYVYCYGDAGKFSKINTQDEVSFIGSVSDSHGNGMGFYKDKLIYVKDTCVGYSSDPYAETPTFRDTAIADGIREYDYHPVCIGADQKCYVGNSYELGRFSNVTTTDWDGDVLVFPDQYRIVALANNGFYLVIGLKNAGALKSQGVVAYWDMVSNQVNRWYPLPEEDDIYYIFNNGGWDYIFCGTKIYRSNFDNPPEIWLYRTDMETAKQVGHISGFWKGGMIWAGKQEINCYGAETSLMNPVLHQPFYVSGVSEVSSMFTNLSNLKIYVAGTTNKLYKITTTASSLTGISATTPFIDLGRSWKLHYLKIYTEPLASGDTLTLSLISADSGDELLNAKTFSYASDGAKTTKNLPISGKVVNQVQLSATFTAGNVKIKSFELYGEPMAEIYAE